MTCCCISTTGYELLVYFALWAVPTLTLSLIVEISNRKTLEWHKRLERESEHVERPVDGCYPPLVVEPTAPSSPASSASGPTTR